MNKYSATHPLTGETASRGTKNTYTHAAWVDVPTQTVTWKAYRTKRTSRFHAFNVEAGSYEYEAVSGIISFHSSKALAEKAAAAFMSKEHGHVSLSGSYGAVPVTKIN